MQSPSPATPAYNALLAKIEWKEAGAPNQTATTPELQLNLDELLAALAAMQDAQRRRRH